MYQMCLSILELENDFPVCRGWDPIGRDRTVEQILMDGSQRYHGDLERVGYEHRTIIRSGVPFLTLECSLSLPLSAMLGCGSLHQVPAPGSWTFQPLVL